MRLQFLKIALLAFGVATPAVGATNEIEVLRLELQQAKAAFERAQSNYLQQVENLSRRIEQLTEAGTTNAPRSPEPSGEGALRVDAARPSQPSTPKIPAQPWSPAQPIPLLRAGPAYMNISFDALLDVGWSTASEPAEELQLGDHDPLNRGFSLPNTELILDGAVDPYFRATANLVFKLDQENETQLEFEEVYLQTLALPANLQIKAGQFFANFGRHNPQHPHQWAFVDQPLVLNRAFGPDGLRNLGGQISWLAPAPFYTELFLGVFNGNGETAFSFRNPGEEDDAGVERFAGRATRDRSLRGPGDLLLVPRWASSFELTDSQTLLVGASAGFGPNNTGPRTRSEIYGVDAYWKWKPTTAQQGFPFLAAQSELLFRRFEAGADPGAAPALRAEEIEDWGFYSQLLWGIRPRWVAGVRGEWVSGNNAQFDRMDVFRGDRTRLAPVLTWYPSEFSKIRLQYNFDRGQRFGTEHSVWLQLEFLLGSHAAHTF